MKPVEFELISKVSETNVETVVALENICKVLEELVNSFKEGEEDLEGIKAKLNLITDSLMKHIDDAKADEYVEVIRKLDTLLEGDKYGLMEIVRDLQRFGIISTIRNLVIVFSYIGIPFALFVGILTIISFFK